MIDLTRSEILIGAKNLQKIKNANIAIVGCGGVGGYVAHFLARAGIKNLTLVDFDTISKSNLNRQIVANKNTIGRAKVDVLKEQLTEIDDDINVKAVFARAENGSFDEILKGCDFIVDCIDSVKNKTDLIIYAKANNIDIVTACGAGNRYDLPHFVVCDIYKTSGDGLARAIRQKLKKAGVKDLAVVISTSPPVKHSENVIASVSYYPPSCASVIAGYVINKIIEKD